MEGSMFQTKKHMLTYGSPTMIFKFLCQNSMNFLYITKFCKIKSNNAIFGSCPEDVHHRNHGGR